MMGQPARRSQGRYGRHCAGVLGSGRAHRYGGNSVRQAFALQLPSQTGGKRILKSCTVLFQGLPAQRTKLLKRKQEAAKTWCRA